MYDLLFTEKKIGNLSVPNRIVMTAMGNHMALSDGYVSDHEIAFYGARAAGGVGLVITECLPVDYDHGKGNLAQMSAHSDDMIPGLVRVAEAVHAGGGKVCGQIYHPGMQGEPHINGVETMPAPSKLDNSPTHEMTKAEIDDVIVKFAAAAVRLKEAGFDAVEIHAAHGYLLTEFLSPFWNHRTDEYGGSLENRLRLTKEIMAAVREAVGADYPMLVRISVEEHLDYANPQLAGQGIQLEEGIEMCKAIESYGADAIDVSCGVYMTMNTAWEPVSFDEGWKIYAPAAVKAAVSIPVIGVSVIRNPSYAEQVLQEGKVDFVASARQFYADPEWGNKAKQGREDEIRRCISCLHCMETLGGADKIGCTAACAINFQGGREATYGDEALKKDGAGKTVVIIGAGPSGLEAAIVAAKRGFEVIIFEKKDVAGGQMLYASKPPKKEKMLWFNEYQMTMIKKLGVDLRLNTEPSIEDIKALDPYAVIIAAGSSPIKPGSIPGLDQDNVVTPPQILSGEVVWEGKNIGVIGTGMTGIETAELLADTGNTVSLFEMVENIGPGLFFQNLMDVMKRLGPHNPGIYTQHKLVKIDGNKAVFEKVDTGEVVEFTFDVFLLSLGVRSNANQIEEFKLNFDKVYIVGDALQGGRLEPAITTGYKAAFEM
jgi:2,4-dienoyl-CoA reductase-like NADH-dependent reductase (Old Yellow Enzyme family)/thioredoxin reductase